MKQDTKFGELIDAAFGHKYGEDFKWERAVITNGGNGNYIVGIDMPQTRINPAVVCFQMCKHLKTTITEDGKAVYCDIEGECPLGKWEPTVNI